MKEMITIEKAIYNRLLTMEESAKQWEKRYQAKCIENKDFEDRLYRMMVSSAPAA